MTTAATALIADDEPNLATYLRELLKKAWPALDIVAVARNGVEAAERIAALEPDLAFLDIKMPGLTGLEVAQGIEGRTRVVFITAYDEFAVAAFEQQALDYVLKPVQADRLARTVERLQRELATARSAAPGSTADPQASDGDAAADPRLAAVLRHSSPRRAARRFATFAPARARSRTRSTSPTSSSSMPTTSTPASGRRARST